MLTFYRKVFARKLIRRFGALKNFDSYDVIGIKCKGIKRVCTAKRSSRFLVEVLGYGWLEDLSFYYVDMELCDIDLARFLLGRYEKFAVQRNIWIIVYHIANGIEFLHQHGWVHGDITPDNGDCLELNSS
jgi:serine/threonine protein kinase